MFCTNCGAQVEQGARFCQDCGTPVGDNRQEGAVQGGLSSQPTQAYAPVAGHQGAQPTQVMSPVQAYRQPQAQQPRAYQPAQPASAKHKSVVPAIAVGIVCVIAIAAIAFVVIGTGLRGGDSQGAPSSAAIQASSDSGSSAQESDEVLSQEASSSSASASSASAQASSDSASSEAKQGFDQSKAEDEARQQAIASGMQVFSGTVRMTTYGQRAAEVDSSLVSSFRTMADEPLALLEFSMPETMTAASAGDMGQLQTRQGQGSIALSDPYAWSDFDGQLVAMAAYGDDLVFPSDVAGALYSAIGSAELISPLTEARAASLSFERAGAPQTVQVEDLRDQGSSSAASASASSAATTQGGYVLPDSASHKYTKSELSGYSDHDLFIARNEIYARHGRKFLSADLQNYFNSQSWYKGTVEAAAFDESVLSDTELANASLILEIEQSHNSKYL